ncbi:hypothetical protein NDU88_010115 [Pleurodeles waltl]|uniref:Uncharacterized protein n=1 Tax=Pleurodeles waltl TaxID=8319 RepID=A0AAV7S0C1_PLEWA|nr:hypothetical protein NDU88_010115 [Pleurodeles waltl]
MSLLWAQGPLRQRVSNKTEEQTRSNQENCSKCTSRAGKLDHPRRKEGLLLGVTLDPSHSRHLKLDIEVQVKKKKYLKKGLVDSGATGNFMDAQLVRTWGIPCTKKKTPEIMQALDRKLLTGGPVTLQTVPLSVTYNGGDQNIKHEEKIIFDVIHAPQYGIILGLPWLSYHNPEINWSERKIEFSSILCQEKCLQTSRVTKPCKAHVATAAEKDVTLPWQYSSYLDVFDEREAETLPPHRPYDCQINLTPGAVLPSCRV